MADTSKVAPANVQTAWASEPNPSNFSGSHLRLPAAEAAPRSLGRRALFFLLFQNAPLVLAKVLHLLALAGIGGHFAARVVFHGSIGFAGACGLRLRAIRRGLVRLRVMSFFRSPGAVSLPGLARRFAVYPLPNVLQAKKYNVETLNDPALWQSAPIEPKTPPNPMKNDKAFLKSFPYLAEPW